MTKLFAFYVLVVLTDSPLIALLALVAVVYFFEGQYRGRYFNPLGPWRRYQGRLRLQREVENNPADALARAELGRVLVEAGHHEQARVHLEKALAKVGDRAEPHYHLGLALLGLGQQEAGFTAIDRALEIRSDLHYGAPHLRRGDFLVARGKTAEALPHLERFTRMNASSSEGYYKLGLCQRSLGNNGAARLAFEEAGRAYSQSPGRRRHNRRWWVLAKLASLRG